MNKKWKRKPTLRKIRNMKTEKGKKKVMREIASQRGRGFKEQHNRSLSCRRGLITRVMARATNIRQGQVADPRRATGEDCDPLHEQAMACYCPCQIWTRQACSFMWWQGGVGSCRCSRDIGEGCQPSPMQRPLDQTQPPFPLSLHFFFIF